MLRKIVPSFVAHWTKHEVDCILCAAPPPPGLFFPRNVLTHGAACCAAETFDVLLTRDLSYFHSVDSNPYAPRTDALLFMYAELTALSFAAAAAAAAPSSTISVLRVFNSRVHPTATCNAPEH